ncbi:MULTISPECIES: transaldolase family protein [Lacticaseibacillus]|uniref:Transaldolase n=2 Tax=Lacticaseibacillus TaxID=2759736 RepID=A0AAN1F0Y4_LACCA|nr:MULTISPECIES: transaldolase family protein [Lacticaseibacillus]ARY92718.1 transaldolase [Lacticaseibacillus casei]KAB1969440.1 transaldolase [Lacticaseibacillus casei]WLV80619.1 transaldolase family protein [Lacticaseibacillus sp. NCIMB 15473]WNX24579.1 transaldolase family protein [Lacticaseibacillus casei]WNX27351.1 transaldolase family protein [Lacticaseibacillus casei]
MFIDTANLAQIKEMLGFNQFEGVTTNPKLLLKEGNPRFEQLTQIRALKPGVLFVQLVGDTEAELLADYHELRKRFPDTDDTRMAFKVPLFEPGYRTISTIRSEKPDECLLGTAVYSVRQGFMACVVDCDYIAPYVNRMEQLDIDPYRMIAETHAFYQKTDTHIKIMGASFKNASQVMAAIKAGAENVTISYDIFQQLMTNAAADDAIRVFNEEGRQLDQKTGV